MNTKNLFAALIGRPNVGKSTLLNALLGEKIAIVSSKPQTTRTRITGILTRDDTQFVFLDTPGVHTPKNKLGDYMMQEAGTAVGEVDVILFLVEARDKLGATERDLLAKFHEAGVPALLLVNKTDEATAQEIGDTIARFSEAFDFTAVIPISAKNGDNVPVILSEIAPLAAEGPWFFPEDSVTDQPERVIAAEIIREKLLQTLSEEIPHGTAVVIEEFKEKKDLLSVRAEIFCEKASHKPIIIGKNGDKLKRIGSLAREDMERFFGTRVYLNLWVKIKENWRDSTAQLANFGFKNE